MAIKRKNEVVRTSIPNLYCTFGFTKGEEDMKKMRGKERKMTHEARSVYMCVCVTNRIIELGY